VIAMSSSTCDRLSRAIAILLALGIVAGIAIPAGPGWDFANFYDAGHKILAGQPADLYDANALIEGRQPQGRLPYYGAPLTAALFAPLALLPPWAAMIAFKIQNTAALLLGLWLLYRWALPAALDAGLSASQYRAIFLAAALLFQPLWTIYRVGGQTTPTLFLGFVLALRWFANGRMLPAAVCMVAVIAIKPAFIFTLAILALFGGAAFFAWSVAAGLATAGLSVLIMGWPLHQHFLSHITEHKISPWTYNSSLSVFVDNLYTLTGPAPALTLGGTAVRLIAAVVVLAVLLRGRNQRHWIFLSAVALGVMLMPIVWEHYLSVLFLPMAYVLAHLPRLGTVEIALAALVCGFCFTQNLILVMTLNAWWQPHSAAALLAAALYKSAPLILFTILLWRNRTRLTEMSSTA
jgi:Glycosyltransferase family 87